MTPTLKNIVLADREKRARTEKFRLKTGVSPYGPHFIANRRLKNYEIWVRDFPTATAYCTCPDFRTNQLGTCKHIMYALPRVKRKFGARTKQLAFRVAEIAADPLDPFSITYFPRQKELLPGILTPCFDGDHRAPTKSYATLLKLLPQFAENEEILVRSEVYDILKNHFEAELLKKLAEKTELDLTKISVQFYDYQKKGIEFGTFSKGAILADEMGLGKTLQAIAVAMQKKRVFDFKRTLVICPASLKQQWEREILRYTAEIPIVIQGPAEKRREIYANHPGYFVIANYETIMRDVAILTNHPPDFIILDEAQKIKNFETKTAEAVKAIPKKHCLVITGTPIENRLMDFYSIVQFADDMLLAPLWKFSERYFVFDKEKKDRIVAYTNLAELRERVRHLVLRREKRDVLSELPDLNEVTIPVPMTSDQAGAHASYANQVSRLLGQKYLTPADREEIQRWLLLMRMTCDSLYLVDKTTRICPKLAELEDVLIHKLDMKNNARKIIIFSEWKRMIELIGNHLDKLRLGFVVLSGDVKIADRGALIREFETNPECRVFISTEAGGSGLNLQVADTVINFDLPWNPAKKNQRIGRIDRLGQKAPSLLAINLVTENSLEERIAEGLEIKQDLFDAVLDENSTTDTVDLRREKEGSIFSQLKEMSDFFSKAAVPGQEEVAQKPRKKASDKARIVEEAGEEYTVPSVTAAPSGAELPQSGEPLHAKKLEETLQQGMAFLSGLMQLATGETLAPGAQSIEIDAATGEVTLKFKLPQLGKGAG